MLGPSTSYDWKTKVVSTIAIRGAAKSIRNVEMMLLRPSRFCSGGGSVGRFKVYPGFGSCGIIGVCC